jgi:hypothetical protein
MLFFRKQVVTEMLDIQQLVIGLMEQIMESKYESQANELVSSSIIALLNDLFATYLVAQYCLAKLMGIDALCVI